MVPALSFRQEDHDESRSTHVPEAHRRRRRRLHCLAAARAGHRVRAGYDRPTRSRRQARRHASLRRAQRAGALRRPPVGHRGQHRAAEPDVRHAAAAQPEGWADDHSRPRAALGDFARRQKVHVPPPQGREVPRRRRFHGRRREGDLRAHRAAAQGRGHPAHAALRDRGRHRRRRSAHDRVPTDGSAAQGIYARRVRERLEHHRAQEDARGEPGQPAPGDELPGHGPVQARLAQGQGNLDHGALPRLLEQGAAARGQARDLPFPAVHAGAGRVVPVGPRGLRAAARSRHVAARQGDARRHRRQLQPVGHPGLLDQHAEEQGAGRSARAPRHPSGHGPSHADRGRQGHGPDAGGRLRLPVPPDVDPARRAREKARLSEGRQAGRAGGSQADGGGGVRSGSPQSRLRRARHPDLQALGRRHSGHAQRAFEHRKQPESRSDVGLVR